MKKFGKEYIKKEKKYTRIEDNNDDFLDSLIRRKINSLNINSISDKEYNSRRLIIYMFFHYSEMPYSFRKWYDKEILDKYNNRELLDIALKELTYQTYNKNKKNKERIIKSLKITNLVNDIKYIPREKRYIIKTKKGKYNLEPIAKNLDEAMDNLGYCHQVTEDYAKKNIGIDVVCGYYKDSLYNDRYHSIAINKKTNQVIDIAHNMLTDVDLYLNELDYKIIVQEESETYFKNLHKLNINNDLFKKSNIYNLLKYTINKQIKIQEENNYKKKLLK